MSRHTGSCATAMSPGCDCPCMHARHGLDGRLRWAIVLSSEDNTAPNPSPDLHEAKERQDKATNRLEKRTAQARKSKRSRGMSKANTNAAFEYARTVDLVEWLVKNPTERDQLKSLVELLVKTSEELLAASPEAKRPALRKRVLDHLWCDLVASVVCAVEEIGTLESLAKDKLAEAVAAAAVKLLTDARATEQGKPSSKTKEGQPKTKSDLDAEASLSLDSSMLEGCVRGVTKIALDGATAGLDAYRKIILLKLRVAALMLCPDVIVHELVWKHCWLPLWHDAVLDAALEDFTKLVDGLNPNLEVVNEGIRQ